ncbi:uncharacterized protein B0T15DRAFT_507940 [Chaetomium strumarium]|uniref:Helicase C-terminal domain-containing protein n=1 Tax=Chaetomium strumarium TaxID=1170767 RepID=A0AAJ0M771_9PEZI|nr:hypothetical protein B0T15DRAFT_507940 [Chaetomium strumarium]
MPRGRARGASRGGASRGGPSRGGVSSRRENATKNTNTQVTNHPELPPFPADREKGWTDEDFACFAKYPFFPAHRDISQLHEISIPAPRLWLMSATNPEFVAQHKKFDSGFMTSHRLPTHGGYHNMHAFLDMGLEPPGWWQRTIKENPDEGLRYPVIPAESEPQSAQRAATVNDHSAKRLKGQTLAYVLEVNSNLTNSDYAAILSYPSVQTMALHTDLEGKLAWFKQGNCHGDPLKYPGTQIESWSGLFSSIPDMFTSSGTAPLFKALASAPSPIPVVYVRRGDIQDPVASTAFERYQIATTPTIIAGLLAYLKNTTVGANGQGAPRYVQHALGTPGTYGGYHADDWVRAVLHMLYFLDRRSGKQRLDGKNGPKGVVGKVYLFRVEDSGELLSAELHAEIAQNVQSLQNFHLSTAVRSERKTLSAEQRRELYTTGEIYSRMYKRTMTLLMQDFANLQRDNLRRKNGEKRPAPAKENDIPPMSGLILHELIDHFYKDGRFKEPRQTRIEGDITKSYPQFFKGDESFQEFLSTQEQLVDHLAEADRRPGESWEQTRDRVEQELKLSFAIKEILERGHPFVRDPNYSDAKWLTDAVELSGWLKEPEPPTPATEGGEAPGPSTPAPAGQSDSAKDPRSPLRFDYASLKAKYPWAQWDLGGEAGKHLLAHQLIDALIIHKLESMPFKTWLCMNEVGTGKTFTYIHSVSLAVAELERKHASGEAISAWPTLVAVPASLLAQTFTEAVRNFPGLKFHAWYGHSTNIGRDDPRKGATLSTSQFDEMMHHWSQQKGSPNTARNVVLTSYTTMAKRWVSSVNARYKPSEMVGPWKLDQVELRKRERGKTPMRPDPVDEDGSGSEDGDDDVYDEDMDSDVLAEPVYEPVYDSSDDDALGSSKPKIAKCKIYTLRMTSCKDFKWRCVIADEAATMRHRERLAWRMIRLIPKEALGFVSATPAQNRETGGMDRYFTMPPGLSATDLIADDFRPSYEGLEAITRFSPDENSVVAQLKHMDEVLGHRWWFLSETVQSMITDGRSLSDRTNRILKQNQLIVLNRGMNTKVTLPNGQAVYPQDNIPPMRIISVELGYGHRANQVVEETDSILANISLGKVDVPEGTDHIHEDSRPTGAGENQALSLALVRALQYLAHDFHAWRMLYEEDDVTKMETSRLIEMAEEQRKASRSLSRAENVRKATKAHLTSKGKPARLGTELVQRIVHDCSDGGLSWVYATLNRDPDHMPPSERPAMTHFAMADSPSLAFVLKTCLEYKEKGKRVLVVVNSPWIQQMTVAALRKASFNTLNIHSGMSTQMREAAMQEWNSESAKVDVLVLNSAVSSAGLNCHLQCSVGIGFGFVWNVSTILQFIGRLFRIGQKWPVEWYLPHVISPRIRETSGADSDAFQQLFAYEAARLLIVTPFNRYAWVSEPPQSIADYSTRRNMVMGDFFSALVQKMMTDPPPEGPVFDTIRDSVPLIGSVFVDKYLRTGDSYRDVTPEDMTWSNIYDTVPQLLREWEERHERFCMPPIGEPERDQSAFRTRGKAVMRALNMTPVKTPRKRAQASGGSSGRPAGAGKRKAEDALESPTKRVARRTGKGNAVATPSSPADEVEPESPPDSGAGAELPSSVGMEPESSPGEEMGAESSPVTGVEPVSTPGEEMGAESPPGDQSESELSSVASADLESNGEGDGPVDN